MLTRPLGRPKNRWEDDIINDMKKLKIKNWTSCIQDRNKWNYMLRRPKRSKNSVVAPKEEEEEEDDEFIPLASNLACFTLLLLSLLLLLLLL
jgi:hypothetical protein